MLDVSDSTEHKIQEIQSAAIAFLDQLQPDDRVLVVAFDKHIQILAEATSDRDQLRTAIRNTHTGHGTTLYGAIDFVINHRLRNIAGRKAIVLFTDGVDTASKEATFDSTVSAATMSDAVIYPIQYNTYEDFIDSPSRTTPIANGPLLIGHNTPIGEPASEAYKRAARYLRLLAAQTGGTMQYSDSIKYLSRSFTRIATELRQQYTLGYYPKNRDASGSPRQIKVKIEKPGVSATARKNYTYAPPR